MKKLIKDIGNFGKASVSLGVGSMIAAKTGVSGVSSGLNAASDFMPTIGTAMMAKHTLRMTRKLRR